MNAHKTKDVIDIVEIFKTSKKKKKSFVKIWIITFILACLWVFPQPRYYKCDVILAPEVSNENMGANLSSIASNFGFNIGATSNDAIYPELYPDLMSSNEFIIGLLNTKITTKDKLLITDYYTYLLKHQKKNWLLQPLYTLKASIRSFFSKNNTQKVENPKNLNPFILSEFDFKIVENTKSRINCYVNKKTDVITITFKDQDPYVCATMVDTVKFKLQEYITDYRTSKARMDVEYFGHLTDSTYIEYNKAVKLYSDFCDKNRSVFLQEIISQRDKLENDMKLKHNAYTAMRTNLESAKVKLQEKTPAFTTLKSATVPIKPAGPKRIMFVFAMLVLATFATIIKLNKDEFAKLFIAK